MKSSYFIFIIGLVVLLLIGYFTLFSDSDSKSISSDNNKSLNAESFKVVEENLNVPWDVSFLTDGSILLTERPGTLLRIEGDERTEISRPVASRGEGGLLGLALHPDFDENNFIYLYETREVRGGLINRVTRYEFDLDENELSDELVIVDNIPGASYHDGGRLRFGPDGYLYITTGDAGVEDNAQDIYSLAGKILRVIDDGSIPSDNPFDTEIYSYGHRNPQGLTWDDQGNLWSTEHGRSGILSGYDELNLIKAGGNYGWPVIQGDETRSDMITPVLHSGADTTWAPASLLYLNGSLYWGGLRGESLYSVVVEDEEVSGLNSLYKNEFGRIRTVVAEPGSESFVFTTSNTDGRGDPAEGDDKLIRVFIEEIK